MNFADVPLHFLRAWWWLALLPLPLALWMLARNRGGRAAFARLVDATLLPHLVQDGRTRRRLALGLVAAAWVLGVAALAGPAWQKVPTPLYVNGAARVVALSLSSDMLAQDLPPDRMTRARFAVRDLLDTAGDARTALVAYAGAAFTVAPLTDDRRTVLNLLAALRPDVMPVPGNDAAAGINRSVRLLRQSQVAGGEIVLVTDTAGAAAVTAARAAHAHGIRVDVLGIGTTAGAPIPQPGGGFASAAGRVQLARRDDAALRAVAVAGGGRYVVLPADAAGSTLFAAPVARAGHASAAARAQLWRDGGIWLLPILLALAAVGFRRGWLLVALLLALPLGAPVAHAGTLGTWFANRDQQALQALQDGNAAQAQKLAMTPGVRGAADYRAGDYASAAKAFAEGDDARSRYNLGNALAKQGRYQAAMAAYRQALQRDPGMRDARANLDAVKAWLKRNPQTPPPKPGDRGGQPRNGASRPGADGQDKSGRQPQSGRSGTQPAPPPSAGAATGSQARRPGAGAQGSAARRGAGGAGDSAAAGSVPTAGAATRQRTQEQTAARGLARELHHAGAGKPFALGQTAPRHDGPFNAEQRALLQAVPDDPGALLRRKFQLEWAQRRGQRPQERGQP
ncbi:MAG: VWA domain-containing protein [Rhodanobacteraceae bacterium]|nr:MAG: VWA domain-containing protein [Rhodanobacteraceae bacterium]